MMTHYQTTQPLNAHQAAYIAGLIDGEGTVTLTRKHANENRQLAVTISSTERQLLEFVLNATGAGKITNKRKYREAHRRSFTYAIYNRQALRLLEQVAPFLLSYKRERTALIIRDYVALTPRNGKYSAEMKADRIRFEAEVLAIKP